MSKSFKQVLAEARRPRRIVSICMRGDLTAEAQRLEDALEHEQKSSAPARLADGGHDEAIAEDLESVRQQMEVDSVQFELEAFSTHKWRSLKAKHPLPEKPAPVDSVIGAEAFPFFMEAVRDAIIDPKVDDEDWARMTGVQADGTETDDGILPDGEWSKLVEAVYALNEQPVSIPFSLNAYEVLRRRSAGSTSPEPQGAPQES